jgi:hypothetical protein
VRRSTQRLLALAAIYDGGTRTEAAKIGGVGLQRNDVAARPTLPSTPRCAWMATGRGIEGHENDVAALGVGRNDGASADSHRLCRDATDLNQSNISCLVELGLKVKK